jgi:flagellar basal body rod protein FlgG
VNNFGYLLMVADHNAFSAFWHGPTMRAVYNNMDITANAVAGGPTLAVRLTDFVTNQLATTTVLADGVSTLGNAGYQSAALHTIPNKQDLTYSKYGSTNFEIVFTTAATTNLPLQVYGGTSTILTKSLEASNASMTQSVPELSLAQKLFSALTKVLQTKQTNVDGVLNLVR